MDNGSDMSNGIYQIHNREGMICYVNTSNAGGDYYGKAWSDICESKLNGKVLDGIIDRYQYKTMRGEPVTDIPSGYIVKLQNGIEAFLPLSSASWRDFNIDCSGCRIAVVIEEFDPMSKTIIAKELRTTTSDFDIEKINATVDIMVKAGNEEKYIRGTVIDEKINNGHGNRAGYLVTINGLEAFLPCRLSYLPNDNIDHLINHNVLTTIEEIDGDKMSIILSMQLPYKELIADLPPPVNGEKTTGILTWVTLYNAYVLLPDETLGVIPQYRYPEKQPEYWEEQTGSLVDCIPYRKKFGSKPDDTKSFYVRLAGN